LRVNTLHVEHALLEIEGALVSPEVGDTIEFWVNYLEPTLALHSCIYGVRDGEVEELFRSSADALRAQRCAISSAGLTMQDRCERRDFRRAICPR
jgi:hypothetical protein